LPRNNVGQTKRRAHDSNYENVANCKIKNMVEE
jgi:hypothetical protein